MERLEILRQKLSDLQAAHAAYEARFDTDPDKAITPEEQEIVASNLAEFERVSAEVEMLERMQAQRKAADENVPRRSEPESIMSRGAPLVSKKQQIEHSPTYGFANLGEMAQCAIRAAYSPSAVDPRLLVGGEIKAEGGMQEAVGSDGGFLVAPDFRNMIMTKVMGEETLFGRTDVLTTSSNSVTVPVDEVTPWDDSQGVQAYWEGEGRQKMESKGKLDQAQVRLNKLYALVRVTDEVMEDAPLLDGYLRRKVPEKFDHRLNMALVRGSGAGMPLGILNSPFTVEAPSTTAAAAIVEFADIVAIWARMYAPWRSNAVWLVHPQMEERLPQIAFDPGSSTLVPVYLPANSMAGSPYATLFGRPVIPHEVCSAPSDPGDIIFASWAQYMSVTKGGGIRTDTSIHVYFDTDETALRFVLRVGGQPWYRAKIAAREGTFDRSGFVTLADRT